MAILIDTQALVWVSTGDARLSSAAKDVLFQTNSELFVSAVTAYEFADLNRRGRFGADLELALILSQLDAVVLDYPAEAYRLVPLLPLIHRDPVDRMMIAHAIHSDLTLITGDAAVRDYPVRTIW